MALPSTPCIPASVFVSLVRSDSANPTVNQIAISFAPTNPDNSVFNLTDATAYVVNLDNGQPYGSAGWVYQQPANTQDVHSTAGGSLHIAATAISAAVTALIKGGVTSGKIMISGTDGSLEVILATGTWNVSLVP